MNFNAISHFNSSIYFFFLFLRKILETFSDLRLQQMQCSGPLDSADFFCFSFKSLHEDLTVCKSHVKTLASANLCISSFPSKRA